MDYPSLRLICLLLSVCYGCQITPFLSLPPNLGLRSVGIDPVQDHLIYLGTNTQSIVLDTVTLNYTSFLPSISTISDFIWDNPQKRISISTTQHQAYMNHQLGEEAYCIGCFNFTSPQCGLLDAGGEALYISDQDPVKSETTIQVYNFTTGGLVSRQTVSTFIWAMCIDPNDPNYYFAMTGNEISKFSYFGNNVVKVTSSNGIGDELRACTVVGKSVYILDKTNSVIWRFGTVSPFNGDTYAGQGSQCSGDFGSHTLVDFAIWRDQLLVVTREGQLYLIKDTIWNSPVKENFTQPVSSCVKYNNSGILSYTQNNLILCDNSSINVTTSQVETWDNLKIIELGNLEVLNLMVNNSEVSIEGNLNLIGSLTIQGESYFQIYGNFSMLESSKLSLQDSASLLIDGCISLNGQLTLHLNFSVIQNENIQMIISNFSCYTGQFHQVIVNPISEVDPCQAISPELIYSPKSLYVSYHVWDQCDSVNSEFENIKLTMMILVPSLFIIAVIMGALYHFYRKAQLHQQTNFLRKPSSPVLP